MNGTVLVVDDDAAIVDAMTMALEDEGYHVLSALDEAALRIACAQGPDVILLDLNMPHMDGVEVSRRLRADPRTAGIPIIAMSATHNLQAMAPRMSADDQLPKPFELTELYAAVGRWVRPSVSSRRRSYS